MVGMEFERSTEARQELALQPVPGGTAAPCWGHVEPLQNTEQW